jgi:hypothetical protein
MNNTKKNQNTIKHKKHKNLHIKILKHKILMYINTEIIKHTQMIQTYFTVMNATRVLFICKYIINLEMTAMRFTNELIA